MLRPEVTIYDVIFIIFMITNLACMYAGYRWGRQDGYYEGCHARRQIERQIRRMR